MNGGGGYSPSVSLLHERHNPYVQWPFWDMLLPECRGRFSSTAYRSSILVRLRPNSCRVLDEVIADSWLIALWSFMAVMLRLLSWSYSSGTIGVIRVYCWVSSVYGLGNTCGRGLLGKRSWWIRGTIQNTGANSLPAPIWEFPKIRGTLLWGPYNKAPTI